MIPVHLAVRQEKSYRPFHVMPRKFFINRPWPRYHGTWTSICKSWHEPYRFTCIRAVALCSDWGNSRSLAQPVYRGTAWVSMPSYGWRRSTRVCLGLGGVDRGSLDWSSISSLKVIHHTDHSVEATGSMRAGTSLQSLIA